MIWHNLWTVAIKPVLDTIIGFFPNNPSSSVITNISNLSTTLKSLLLAINYVFPIDTLLLVFGLVITIELALFTVRLAIYILQHISFGLIKKL